MSIKKTLENLPPSFGIDAEDAVNRMDMGVTDHVPAAPSHVERAVASGAKPSKEYRIAENMVIPSVDSDAFAALKAPAAGHFDAVMLDRKGNLRENNFLNTEPEWAARLAESKSKLEQEVIELGTNRPITDVDAARGLLEDNAVAPEFAARIEMLATLRDFGQATPAKRGR